MKDKCLRNELMDVKSINLPDFTTIQKNKDTYIYAAFLSPGYHQLLIYDPLLERAFCKDFMVNLNLREDLFPEYPILPGARVKKRVQNVWRMWTEDS